MDNNESRVVQPNNNQSINRKNLKLITFHSQAIYTYEVFNDDITKPEMKREP